MRKYDIPPAIFVRYAFGMVAAAVLFEGWFFLDAPLDNDVVAAILARISYEAILPAKGNQLANPHPCLFGRLPPQQCALGALP